MRKTNNKKEKRNTTLHELFILKLQALYDVEHQIVKALPGVIKKISNKSLKDALSSHLKETEGHITRLEDVFESIGENPKKLAVEAIRGLAEDAKWVLENVNDPKARDAAIIPAMQYVEHYEIAGYGSAKEWAEIMGHDDAAELLDATLEEEKNGDQKLSDIAEGEVNWAVDMGMEDMEEIEEE